MSSISSSGVQRVWAQSWRASLSIEALLYYFLIFCTVAFSRDFAHLHFRLNGTPPYINLVSKLSPDTSFSTYVQTAGIPIFVTEIFLVLILSTIIFRRWREKNWAFERTPLDYWFGFWVLLGVAELVRGIFSSSSVLLALRDLSICYYVIFFYLVREICSNWQRIHWLMGIFVAGTILRMLIANWYYIFDLNFLTESEYYWPAAYRFMSGINGAFILIALLVGIAIWRLTAEGRQRLVLLYLSFATFTLVLTQQRSLFIALVIGFVTLIVGAKVIEAIRPMNLLWIVGGVLLAGTLTWLVRVAIGPPAPAPFLGPVKYLVLKTALRPEAVESVGTASFRMDAWREAEQRFLTNPIVGEGFGKPFVFYDKTQHKWWTQDVRPHNTYLMILYKMGLVGMTVFTLIHIVFYKSIYQALYRGVNNSATAYLLAFTGAMVALQVYGFFNLLVESPFLALIYWSLMGVMITMTRLPETTLPVT